MDTSQDTHLLQEAAERFPTDPGVYLFKDEAGRVLYVGKAQSLRTRIRSYFREGGTDARVSSSWFAARARSSTSSPKPSRRR